MFDLIWILYFDIQNTFQSLHVMTCWDKAALVLAHLQLCVVHCAFATVCIVHVLKSS